MPDREKVIKGLECCLEDEARDLKCWENGDYPDCPYNDHVDGCMGRLNRDALTLLKAQEPVKPIIETHWETPSVYDEDVKVTENKCGACGAEIDKWDKFCRVCGKPVKWE